MCLIPVPAFKSPRPSGLRLHKRLGSTALVPHRGCSGASWPCCASSCSEPFYWPISAADSSSESNMLRKAPIRHQLELVRLRYFLLNWVPGAETAMSFIPKALYSWGFTKHRRLSPVSWSQQTTDVCKITEKDNKVSPLSLHHNFHSA